MSTGRWLLVVVGVSVGSFGGIVTGAIMIQAAGAGQLTKEPNECQRASHCPDQKTLDWE